MARARGTTDLDTAFAKAAKGERVVLHHEGERFGLVAGVDLDRLEELDREEDADLLAVALAAEAEAAAKGEEPVPWADVKRRLGLT